MSNPWPAWPTSPTNELNALNKAMQNALWPQPHHGIQNDPKAQLNAVLLQWDAAKKALETAKAAEMELRKQAVALGFGAEDAKEGVNRLELENGYQLKATRKFNYKLVAPVNFVGTKIDAVDACIQQFEALSNEGSFIADRLFSWDVDISVSEYKALKEEATYSPIKKQLLDAVDKVLVISEAAPTLAIEEPKGKKK